MADVPVAGGRRRLPSHHRALPDSLVGVTTLTRRLRQHGIEPRQACNTALAAWASDLPLAVLASLLGVHIQTAVNWASHTRRDWTTYIAERVSTPALGNTARSEITRRLSRSWNLAGCEELACRFALVRPGFCALAGVFPGRSVGECPHMFRQTWPMTSEPSGQPAKGAEIWIICGNACAGKTTTARLLAQRLPLAAHVEGDEMQRLIVSGCRWAVPSDSDPGTGRLTGEAGVQYALRIRNACLVAAAFADAGITAIVTDTTINEGFESLVEVLGGRPVNFVVLRPLVALLRQRGIDRLPEEAAYLADRYGDADHPEAAEFAGRVQAAADGRPVNEFEEVIERGLDRLPRVGLWVDPSRLDPQNVVDLLLDRRAEAVWMVNAADPIPSDPGKP
jgi:hypothetical protein